jgi:hypothetical protein
MFPDRIKKLGTPKTDADSAWPIREYSPVVVCFGSSGETESQNRFKSILFSIDFKEVGIILVVPGLWIEECNAPLAQ